MSATLVAPATSDVLVKVKVVLDSHSAALDGLKFEEIVALRAPDGTDVPPTAVEQAKGGGHHREAVLVLPVSAETSLIPMVVKDVGGVKERLFTWNASGGR